MLGFPGKVMVCLYEILTRYGPERSRENERMDRPSDRCLLSLRSGCIKVDFRAGHEHDVTMDDELDEGDFDGSDDMGFGDEMDF